MSHLFTPFTLRGVTFRNRIWIAPMCQYSCSEGLMTDWHLVHLGSRAVGGAGLVIAEATAVSPEGRISPADAGIWSGQHEGVLRRITDFIHSQGAVAGIQLAHAGRKASTEAPWDGGGPISAQHRGWQALGPSEVPFQADWPSPRPMVARDFEKVFSDFEVATKRSLAVGFRVIEVHAAHGYLLHQFLSPLSNQRTDEFGGSLENRMRFPLEVIRRVRALCPDEIPVFVRISASDWVHGGWDLPQSVQFCRELKKLGVDLIDTSSGGMVPYAKIPMEPSYQVPFADAIRNEVGIPTAAVGLITTPEQAEGILVEGEADAILIARASLRDPYFPLHAAKVLKAKGLFPKQYGRAE